VLAGRSARPGALARHTVPRRPVRQMHAHLRPPCRVLAA
jgi:hypothetical protein